MSRKAAKDSSVKTEDRPASRLCSSGPQIPGGLIHADDLDESSAPDHLPGLARKVGAQVRHARGSQLLKMAEELRDVLFPERYGTFHEEAAEPFLSPALLRSGSRVPWRLLLFLLLFHLRKTFLTGFGRVVPIATAAHRGPPMQAVPL
jgi:hypothetical protein